MVTIQPAKSIEGKTELPSSPDLLFLALLASCASSVPLKIPNIKTTQQISDLKSAISGHVDIECNQDTWSVKPVTEDPSLLLKVPDYFWPYRDMILFLALGMGKTVLFSNLTPERITNWHNQAQKLGITLKNVSIEDKTALQLSEYDLGKTFDKNVIEEDTGPLLAFLLGSKQKHNFNVSYYISNPLRHLAQFLGYELSIKSLQNEADDPIARRMRFLQQKRKGGGGQKLSYAVTADFTVTKKDSEVEIVLPGDETLSSILITAKSLIPKDSFVLANVPLEPWATQLFAFLRKMGTKLTIQESSRTAFGSAGLVSIQKANLSGKKMRCSPLFQFSAHLPSMLILASFSEKQSVFRELEDMRMDTPDGIDLLESCIRKLGARHGEMPDGIVLEGARQFDGFDLTEALPAHIAAAFSIAGLRCIGETSINEEKILKRWPDFFELLNQVCQFRTDTEKKQRKEKK
ncbi:hypothetical protein QA601_00655 [Chitinispirillales bacterium ANBcel5]|uniref:hypothetical protein n=1 Tax=Cellulosispirillum alkaliphilum TaxID=3039283 RepID=UPI002A544C38|nr:hypothetical protein [Chitinispirillales bacterium ANBcel5]